MLTFSSTAAASEPELAFSKIIKSIQGEKCYLNPCMLHVTDEGIYIESDEGLIQIESIECDDDGVFVKGEKCPGCGYALIFGLCFNNACSLGI